MCITLGGFGTQKIKNSIDGKIYLKKGEKMVKCRNTKCDKHAVITEDKKHYCGSCYMIRKGWTLTFGSVKINPNYTKQS